MHIAFFGGHLRTAMHSAHHICATFSAARRPFEHAAAERLAELIGTAALDDVIRQASNDGARDAFGALLAYREALLERQSPPRLARRLIAEADDLDRRSDALDAAVAECFGKAAYRRSRGDLVLADELVVRAQAAEATAAGLREQAFSLRLDAAIIRYRLEQAADLSRIAIPA